MKTPILSKSSSYEDITFFGCFRALKTRKEKYPAFEFEKYRHKLSEVCENCKQWKMITEEALKPLGLEKEINNLHIENLINKSDNEYLYAWTGKIYDFDNRKIIPCDNNKYFLLVTICLNNFSDTHVKNLLAHQLSIFPDKAEFFEQMKIIVREYSGEIISESKALTVNEWIEKNVQHVVVKKIVSTDLSRKEKNSVQSSPPPKGFRKISGKLSDEEIKKFFSFLYEEKTKDGNPYLPEDDVRVLLQHGFGIGDEPSGKYFNLNINSRQKILIKYCFYKLLRSHEKDGISIRDKVLKFLIFNFEQFKPETRKKYLQHHETFSKNFTGVPPAKKMPFDILGYLPKK